MPPKKKISIGGLTKLSSDYNATIDVVEDDVPPTPAPKSKAKKEKERSPSPPPTEDLESDEDIVPEPAKNKKQREISDLQNVN